MEIEVAEEEETLAGEEKTKVNMEIVGSLLGNSKRSHLTPPLIKGRLKILPARYVKNLATLLQRVGSGLRMVVHQIHLDEDQHYPKEETEVHVGQAMVREVEEEKWLPQWLKISHICQRWICIPPSIHHQTPLINLISKKTDLPQVSQFWWVARGLWDS